MSPAKGLVFRRLRREDLALLSEWFAKPHVEPWWRERHDPESIEARYGPSIDCVDPTEVFVVEHRSGEPIGMIQRYRIADDPSWAASLSVAKVPGDAAGIDYLIGDEAMIGRGIGAEVIGAFVEDTWSRYLEISDIVASVAQENRRSWHALEKVGFVRTWSGTIESDDPSDEGPSHVYVRHRVR